MSSKNIRNPIDYDDGYRRGFLDGANHVYETLTERVKALLTRPEPVALTKSELKEFIKTMPEDGK